MINEQTLSQRSIAFAMYSMLFVVSRLTQHVHCASTMPKLGTVNGTECQLIPHKILKLLHKPAFNRNYMSVDSPFTLPGADLPGGIKVRRKIPVQPTTFEMSESNFELLSNEPAWNVEWSSIAEGEDPPMLRLKRDLRPLEVKLSKDDSDADSDDDAEYDKSEESDGSTPMPNGYQAGTVFTDDWDDETETHTERKRTDPPWRCQMRRKWIELSKDYYPRYIRSVQCTKPKCWYGNFGCVAKKMSVRILQRYLGNCADASSLKQLGFGSTNAEVWRWVKVDINFFCECAQPANGHFPFEW